MLNQFLRTEMLLGRDAMEKLADSRVAVFGAGGVGGYVIEALARCGIGEFDIIDNDTISLTNLNRQIIATGKTIGKYKVDVIKERIFDINPEAVVHTYKCFFLPENSSDFPFKDYSYVVDAVDTVTAKIEIVMKAKEAGVPVISSMGTGNKLDAASFKVADIYKTKVCPLAKVMRRELKKRGVNKLKVVYSEEIPMNTDEVKLSEMKEEHVDESINKPRRSVPGSVAFVPPVAGFIIAGEVVKDIISDII